MGYIDKTFSLLDAWRHLPSYQLERRADIFFAVFLPDIIQGRLGLAVQTIVPEFPVREGTIKHTRSNLSYKIDYLVKIKDSNKVLFIELKTDKSSRRGKQDKYLQDAKQVGMFELLEGLFQIREKTKQKSKYGALFEELCQAGFLKPESFAIIEQDYQIDIIYIQPEPTDGDEQVITFMEIAEILSEKQDEFSQRFAKSLREWANIEPGNQEK